MVQFSAFERFGRRSSITKILRARLFWNISFHTTIWDLRKCRTKNFFYATPVHQIPYCTYKAHQHVHNANSWNEVFEEIFFRPRLCIELLSKSAGHKGRLSTFIPSIQSSTEPQSWLSSLCQALRETCPRRVRVCTQGLSCFLGRLLLCGHVVC